MRCKQPLREILAKARDHWDHPGIRLSVRQNFNKVSMCRTPALGAEVYASDSEELHVWHTCKSRFCPSCGWRATLQWQLEQDAALPDVPYAAIGFSMPDVLWPIFKQNRHLLHDLPAIAASVITRWARLKYGARVLVIVVPHTFGRRLNFNCHLHILVSAGGLHEFESRWIDLLHYKEDPLMKMWRYAVITYLRQAVTSKVLTSTLSTKALSAVFKAQYERWWSIHIDHFKSKWQFLRYAGRYARRPPLAQHRFLKITDQEVQFLTKDLKLKKQVVTTYPIPEFVALLGEHVPDHYQHSVRYFGLLSPRSKRGNLPAMFVLLKQEKRPRPPRLSWQNSIRKYFGVDPLTDSDGQPMHWVRQLKPVAR